jgi:hypothetical protein
MSMLRRDFLLSGFAAGFGFPESSTAQALADQANIDDLFQADAEPRPPSFKEPKTVGRWAALDTPPKPQWPQRAVSVDFHHLSKAAPKLETESFSLTGEVLRSLAKLNSFDLSRTREHVLFGLRGCSPTKIKLNFSSSVEVVESLPDHLNLRCLLGVWRPHQNDLWVTSASTVPNVEYMFQMMNGGLACNMFPTGLHRYLVGTHRAGSKYPQRGAFRQLDPVPVLRNRNNLTFELPPTDKYDVTIDRVVADNIHAGVLESSQHPPFFSSAGCQVIPGGYRTNGENTAYGQWAVFRERAGLKPVVFAPSNVTSTIDDGRSFYYMLLTGAEARLIARGQSVLLDSRLRFGSSGPRVRRLSERLTGNSTSSYFDQTLMASFLAWQMKRLNYSDGVIDQVAENEILRDTSVKT